MRPKLNRTLPKFNGTAALDGSFPVPQWDKLHWLGVLSFALILFGFDALETILYDHARAPNVGLVTQLFLLLGFYALWALVARSIWSIAAANRDGIKDQHFRQLVVQLSCAGIILNLLHMASLALILRIMYSPPGWGMADFTDSVTELWIKYAGLWFSMYAAFSLLTVYWLRRQKMLAAPARHLVYEVRGGNRIYSLGVADIHWIEAAENYAQLHTSKGSFLLRKSLNAIEQETVELGMVRCHRAALVNIAYVHAIVRDPENGSHSAELSLGQKIPVGRRRVATLRRQLRCQSG